jgi:hypothetical protein
MIGSPCDVGTPSAGTLKVTYTPAPDGTDAVTTVCSQSNPVYALNVNITPVCRLVSPGGGFPPVCYYGSISITSSPGAISCASNG